MTVDCVRKIVWPAAVGLTALLIGCRPSEDANDTTTMVVSNTTVAAVSDAVPASKTLIRHVDAVGAEQLLAEDKDVIVLDVRTPGEFQEGHIAGATNVDFKGNDFGGELAGLDRGKTYLVHCAAGGRSTRSLGEFERLQFKSVVHLDGGLNAWRAAGKPVEK